MFKPALNVNKVFELYSSLDELITRTLLLDIETTRGGKIRRIGALLKDQVVESKTGESSKHTLSQVEDLASAAEFILGHNLLGHDFPVLQSTHPRLSILRMPVIDTLYLSPLAFPQNPYHRLVKDYKLVRSSVSDPVADARLAASVFRDQWDSFEAAGAGGSHLLDFYRFCFEESLFNGFSGQGLGTVFNAIGAEGFQRPEAALAFLVENTTGIVCEAAMLETLPPLLGDSARRPALAYCLAWLQVAGSNSVLPPWVRYRFPEIGSILTKLRATPCAGAACRYCCDHHNPESHLERYFGFPGFREKPQTPEGKSLQRAVVAEGLRDKPLLAVLPTGGGKSLCYQLPALVRHQGRGMLTVVISPLQALMKDQVDNLVRMTGTPFAAAVNGLQTPPERGEVLERVRLGDVAILYIAPEQLRSLSVRNVLSQREIGCWVFDEAHCVSKWGHDFRPDYLYAARFIREFAGQHSQPVPPICCYTATAKSDVIEDITAHFRGELGQELKLFDGGVERENLDFEVLPVSAAERYERTFRILSEVFQDEGAASAIVYAETRTQTEEIRDFLQHQGMAAEAFHAGLDAKQKRDIIEAFVAGRTPVICATNAFGMGIDKTNVRLVLHFEMPGSLENYIQEAGRAGRDGRLARCVLLYDPEDANLQFRKGAMAEVNKREIERILRALRRIKRNRSGEIVVTSDELLRDEDLAELHAERQDTRDTKVRTAIAWLERAGFLSRNANMTEVFQGRPVIQDLDEAQRIIDTLNLPEFAAKLWLNILRILFNRPLDRGLSADSIAEGLFPDPEMLRQLEKTWRMTPAQMVIQALHDMAEARLIDRGVMLAAILRPKGRHHALQVLQAVSALEERLIALLQAEDPDADDGRWVELDARRAARRLKSQGADATPVAIRALIKGLAMDGKGLSSGLGSLELQHLGRDRYQVRLQRKWAAVKKTARLRREISYVVLKHLVAKAEKSLAGSGTAGGGDVTLSFSSNELSAAVLADIALRSEIKKPLAAIDRALMFLHEHKAITLQGGLAILRQAMTIRMEAGDRARRYTVGDYKPLSVHYREKRFQVHVMMAYAELALDKIARALALVLDYFSLGRIKFVNRYFADRKDVIERATTQEAFRRIVEKLGNPVQVSAVGGPLGQNTLILAGPGSGKTTVIVHRCAYLLQVERVPPRQILVLCFNHSAAVGLRRRLNALAGKDARGVLVATYHGAAMRLTGVSLRELAETRRDAEIDFGKLIRDAVRLLKGETEFPGVPPDEVREQLLGGCSHILVDEYQDIDQAQYDLVSAIAGRTLEESEGRLSIMAVGDDDQNIYAFRGANVEFIRKFQADYPAKVVCLVENYRSSRHIINAANQLIRNNRDRMKVDHPIRINREREKNPAGGRWELIDPVAKGRVQIITVKNCCHQAECVKAELERLKGLAPDLEWEECAILARSRKDLAPIRSLLEQAGLPVKTMLETSLPLHRVREFAALIKMLAERKSENRKASELLVMAGGFCAAGPASPWRRMLEGFLKALADETADATLPVGWAIDALYDFIAEQRREKFLGSGFFLGTIHSTKGMEFPHVIILDGGWAAPGESRRREEERRTLYVGMTRARETLTLMRIEERQNPFLKELKGDGLLSRRGAAPETATPERRFHQYEVLGLNDVFLDYAGGFPPDHSVHAQLAQIQAAEKVFLAAENSAIEIRDRDAFCIGRLSNSAAVKWKARLERIREVRVVAMIERGRLDPQETFRERTKAEKWEVPVLEVVWG
jgi:ATP-dependent DNA helicase RecQ